MKILLNKGYTNVVQKIKNFHKKFFDSSIKLKTLVNDTFTPKTLKTPKNVRHKGDVYDHVPEFIQRDGDTAGISVRKMKFTPKEEEKMANMPLDEMMSYKAKLIEKGKYTYED